MALTAPSDPATNEDELHTELDDEIEAIRAEIQSLTQRRNLLSASLLASTRVRNHLHAQSAIGELPDDLTPLLETSQQHAGTNVHRLAFGVTAFPFTDPNPKTANKNLVGVRFDLCGHDGTFKKPHYLLCRRIAHDSNDLRIHRHTIPVFIPLKDYEDTYLPLQDEGYGSDSSVTRGEGERQDLHKLVQVVRRDLVSWTLRTEAIDLLNEELGLSTFKTEDSDMADVDFDTVQPGQPDHSFGVKSITADSVEARYVKLAWTDGRVGRIKISDEGKIERAVVIGEEGRTRTAERILSEGNISVTELAKRLQMLDQEQRSTAR